MNRTEHTAIRTCTFIHSGFLFEVLNCSFIMHNIVSDSACLSKVVHSVCTYNCSISSQFTQLFSDSSCSGNSHSEPDEQFHFIVIFRFAHSRFSLCMCRSNS